MVVFKNQKLQVQGRVRIPEPILEHLCIRKGDSLEIQLKEDQIMIRRLRDSQDERRIRKG